MKLFVVTRYGSCAMEVEIVRGETDTEGEADGGTEGMTFGLAAERFERYHCESMVAKLGPVSYRVTS